VAPNHYKGYLKIFRRFSNDFECIMSSLSTEELHGRHLWFSQHLQQVVFYHYFIVLHTFSSITQSFQWKFVI